MTFFIMRIEAILHHHHNLERLAPAQSQHLLIVLEHPLPQWPQGCLSMYRCNNIGWSCSCQLFETNCKTFADYAHDVFIKYVKSQLCSAQRIDIVWDNYLEGSLKAITRSRHGEGVRRCVLPDTRVSKNWSSFLRNETNKTELFAFLTEQVTNLDYSPKEVVSTYGQEVKASSARDLCSISPCFQIIFCKYKRAST